MGHRRESRNPKEAADSSRSSSTSWSPGGRSTSPSPPSVAAANPGLAKLAMQSSACNRRAPCPTTSFRQPPTSPGVVAELHRWRRRHRLLRREVRLNRKARSSTPPPSPKTWLVWLQATVASGVQVPVITMSGATVKVRAGATITVGQELMPRPPATEPSTWPLALPPFRAGSRSAGPQAKPSS